MQRLQKSWSAFPQSPTSHAAHTACNQRGECQCVCTAPNAAGKARTAHVCCKHKTSGVCTGRRPSAATRTHGASVVLHSRSMTSAEQPNASLLVSAGVGSRTHASFCTPASAPGRAAPNAAAFGSVSRLRPGALLGGGTAAPLMQSSCASLVATPSAPLGGLRCAAAATATSSTPPTARQRIWPPAWSGASTQARRHTALRGCGRQRRTRQAKRHAGQDVI